MVGYTAPSANEPVTCQGAFDGRSGTAEHRIRRTPARARRRMPDGTESHLRRALSIKTIDIH